jgi:hypothetical protein
MKQGDKFRIRKASLTDPQDEHEVIEELAPERQVRAKNCRTGEERMVSFYEVESDLPKCARCYRSRPRNELKEGVIFFRDRRPSRRKPGKTEAFCNQKTQLFCSDTQCHSHEQMAHEG